MKFQQQHGSNSSMQCPACVVLVSASAVLWGVVWSGGSLTEGFQNHSNSDVGFAADSAQLRKRVS
jgi:hypothetical protein